MAYTRLECKTGSLETINIDNFTLGDFKKVYSDELANLKEIEVKKALLKMQRDLVAITNTIISDGNLQEDKNHEVIKEQIKVLSEYMYSQIGYIRLACEYENTKQAMEVRERLLFCEYAATKYDIKADYEFWEKKPFKEWTLEELNKLAKIHDSELALKTVILFKDSKMYQTIRENNWHQSHLYTDRLTNRHSKRDLGLARNTFRKDRNSALKRLYEVYEYTNSLTDILTSDYTPATYNTQYSIPYNVARASQTEIHNKAKEYQKN